MTRYPLSWPESYPRSKEITHSNFGGYNSKPSVAKATDKLLYEVRLLSGSSEGLIISTNLKLRLDGLPYSNQKQPEDKGAAVYFKYNNKDVAISCDKYNKIGCNLWAIAKTIENMRGIDRWGCSDFLKRSFTGFQALPEKGSNTGWRDILGFGPTEETTVASIVGAFRRLMKDHHKRDDYNSDKWNEEMRAIYIARDQAIKDINH